MFDEVYVVHCKKLKDRYFSIMKQLSDMAVSPILIDFYDPEEITEDILKDNFDENLETKNKKNIFLTNDSITLQARMLIQQKSNALKHYHVWKDICKKNEGLYLVVEDDVVFKKNISFLRDFVQGKDFDFLFCGEGSLRIDENHDVYFKKENPCSNGVCTYVINNNKKFKEIVERMNENKFSFPFDHEINIYFCNLNVNVYYGTTITKHGSVQEKYFKKSVPYDEIKV